MKPVRRQVDVWVYERLLDRVDEQVRWQFDVDWHVSEQVDDQVWVQVDDQVRDQVTQQVWRQVQEIRNEAG